MFTIYGKGKIIIKGREMSVPRGEVMDSLP